MPNRVGISPEVDRVPALLNAEDTMNRIGKSAKASASSARACRHQTPPPFFRRLGGVADASRASPVRVSTAARSSPAEVLPVVISVHVLECLGGAESLPADQRHDGRSEEHTSELQSRENLVCR